MNRGGTIIIQILKPSERSEFEDLARPGAVVAPASGGDVDEMSLPVGFHSPLQVLKEMLYDIVGIPVSQQVLILCDLSDKERNNDRVLTSPFLSLRDLGIKSGDTLTLHGLGLSAELKTKIYADAEKSKRLVLEAELKAASNGEKIHSLISRVDAAHSNHSYAGIMFDIEVKGPHEVDLSSIAIGGMLGRVRIFGRLASWKQGTHHSHNSPSTQGWRLLSDITCRPSWDRNCQIPIQQKFTLLPHTVAGIYIHSALPGDLGIQYQSYPLSSIVAENEYLKMTPGLGHACREACEPFDDTVSWYRQYRCMAGELKFTARRYGWNPNRHLLFPLELRNAVVCMLFCQLKPTNAAISILSDKHIVYSILEFMHWDWFQPADEEDEDEENTLSRAVASTSGMTLLQRLQHMFSNAGHTQTDMENELLAYYFQQHDDHDDDDDDDDDDYLDAEDNLDEEEDEEEDEDEDDDEAAAESNEDA